MEGMLGIFQSVSGGNSEDFACFLNAFNEHQCFRSTTSGRTEFVSHVTGLLSNTTTRYEGLLFLEELLKQSPLDILEQKGALWAGICIKTCSQKNIYKCVPMACRALGILIEKSVDIPELSKSFTNHLLGNYFDSLKNTPTNAALDVLKCIEIALCVYPGSCGPHRGSIEKYVMSFVDENNSNIVNASAKCQHLLQQIRGVNTIGISYQETWQKYQIGILGNLHETLDNAFSDCPEMYISENLEKLNTPALELSDNPVRRASQILIRCKNLISYLIVALTEPYPVPKMIKPRKILNLIQRGLNINCKVLKTTPTSNNQAISALLPEMHIALFSLLDVMILTLKSNMALFVHTYLSCILNTLIWTYAGKSSGNQKPYSSVRIAAYNSLTLWNKTFKNGSCCELIAEDLIEQFKGDTVPFQNEVTLKVLVGSKKHMSKKARRLLHKAQNEQSNIAKTHSKGHNPQNTKIIYSDEGNQQLCIAALNCLTSILQSASCFLKPVLIKDIMDTVYSVAIHVLNCDDELKTDLYSDHNCRLALYNTIYATISDPHHLCPPPIQFAIEVFSIAQNKDRSSAVRSKCSQYLKATEKIVHPQKESIYFPVDKNDIADALRKKNAKENGKIVESDEEQTEDFGNTFENRKEITFALRKKNEYENEEIIESDEEQTEDPENVMDTTEDPGNVIDTNDDEEIVEHIDLTDNLDEDVLPPPYRHEKPDMAELIDNISLGSSSREKSPEFLEVSRIDPAIPSTSRGVNNEFASKSIDPYESDEDTEPLPKKLRTTSEEDEDEVLNNEDEVLNKKDEVLNKEDEVLNKEDDEDSLKGRASPQNDWVAVERDLSQLTKESDIDKVVDECLLDFVDEFVAET